VKIKMYSRIPVGKNSFLAGISWEGTQKFTNGRIFTVVIYAAYKIPESYIYGNNGIAIIDEDKKCIVLDCHSAIPDGRIGPTIDQVDEYIRITNMKWEEFEDFVKNHERYRGCL